MAADTVEAEIISIVRKFADRKAPISRDTAIYHDLHIAGDDAYALLEDLASRFGVKFSGFDFLQFFPSEPVALFRYVVAKLGFSDKKRPRMTIAHLAAVVRNGAWFNPAPSA